VTGVAATAFVGDGTPVVVIGSAVVVPTGIAASGIVGTVNVWGPILPDQTPSYQAVSTSQNPSWTEIAPNQNAGYDDIAA
jgi:hypothetical protein